MFRQVDTNVYFNLMDNILFREDNIFTLEDFLHQAERMANQAINVSISQFSGLSSAETTSFLSDFQSVCLLRNIEADNRKIAMFHLHLTGPARIWYESLQEG